MERHARTLMLEGFDTQAQQALAMARLVVVGAGGLGSGFLPLAASMGVGAIRIIESDRVDITNLPRQTLYSEEDLGGSKCQLAARRLQAYNSYLSLEALEERLTSENAEELLGGEYDLLVDCTDNYATRYLLDGYAARRGMPLLYGAVQGYGGQVTILHGKSGVGLVDLLGPQPPSPIPVGGVFPPAVHIIAKLMATEMVKWLTGIGPAADGSLLVYDGLAQTIHHYTIA